MDDRIRSADFQNCLMVGTKEEGFMVLAQIKKCKTRLFKGTALVGLIGISLFSTSCGNGQKVNLAIPGVSGPVVTLVEDKVLISMVFENLVIDVGLRYAIPKYPHSYLEISPDFQTGGTLMAVEVAIEDILKGQGKFEDPKKLPGGRPLPGVLGGQLPAVAFSIEKFHNMTFYLGNEVFGFFVPIENLDLKGSIVTARFYIKETRAGNLSLVGEDDQDENGGFLLLLSMKSNVKKELAKIDAKYN